ncbi:MAG: HAMP domain-containing histidine kinase [Cyclobacteriaceae bacterium]|nr:HAMP domain-containing histidine kinase [Cyclobacteriaceae bacterium]
MLSLKRVLLFFLSCCFLTAGFYVNDSYREPIQPDELSKTISQNIRTVFRRTELEATLLRESKDNLAWQKVSGSFLRLNGSQLVQWNNNSFVPDMEWLQQTFHTRLLQTQRASYLIRKWPIDSSNVLVAVIPLLDAPKAINKYLQHFINEEIFPVEELSIHPFQEKTLVSIFDENNTGLFSIEVEAVTSRITPDWTGLFLFLIGIACLVSFCVNILRDLHQQGKYELTFIAGLSVSFLIRIGMLFADFPKQWGSFALFDPQLFASSFINSSLGDFLINSIIVLFFCGYVFLHFHHFKSIHRVLAGKRFRLVWGSVLITLALFSFLFPFLFYEIIFHNSSILIDIGRNMEFSGMRVAAYITIITGSLSSFLFGYVFLKLAIDLDDKSGWRFGAMLLIGSLLFLFYCYLDDHDYSITLFVALIYFITIRLTNLHKTLAQVTISTFTFLLIAVAAYALQGALSIRQFSRESLVLSMQRFGNNNLINHDILGEYLMAESVKAISTDPFIVARFTNPLLPKGNVRQRIEKIYLNSYFDRYASKIYLYNSAGQTLDSDTLRSLATSIQSFQHLAIRTGYEGVFWLRERGGSLATRRYLGIAAVTKVDAIVGYVVLELSLKSLASKNVYPELLVDNRFVQFVSDKDFNYAFYLNDSLAGSVGDFNYAKGFDRNSLKAEIFNQPISHNGYLHTAMRGDENLLVIISTPDYRWFDALANFSFLFIISLFLIFCWMLIHATQNYWRGRKMNYSTRIQLYIYLAFILPLVVVSTTIVRLIGKENETELELDYRLRAEQMGATLSLQNDSPNVREVDLAPLAQSFHTDVNLYSPEGKLITSSQPGIFDNQLISSWINPMAKNALAENGDKYFVAKERIGLLSYNSSYLAITSPDDGKLKGILNLPFFKSDNEASRSLAIVLSNILIVFVLVFILFSIASHYAIQWLTFPLRMITKTLGKTTLNSNQPLQWKSEDEIGLMVREYNRMLATLEQSKIQLANTQKESAWREMAQQVAHEIKNPLTPMKLTLQQMELNARADENKLKSIRLLLEQVELLNDIASSFSTFAKMPTPQLQQVELMALLNSVVALYASQEGQTVELKSTIQSVMVRGDEKLLTRVFSNLVLNGLQSSVARKASVWVNVEIREKRVVIDVKDNGDGIPEDYQSKIFTPYFSSKQLGSGLGLPIVKQGVEQCEGTINFVTQIGAGTLFQVSFPLLME